MRVLTEGRAQNTTYYCVITFDFQKLYRLSKLVASLCFALLDSLFLYRHRYRVILSFYSRRIVCIIAFNLDLYTVVQSGRRSRHAD